MTTKDPLTVAIEICDNALMNAHISTAEQRIADLSAAIANVRHTLTAPRAAADTEREATLGELMAASGLSVFVGEADLAHMMSVARFAKLVRDETLQARAALHPKQEQEPLWYAVMSKEAPVINKAMRREDVAQEYADKCRETYPGVEVVPLFAAHVQQEPIAWAVSAEIENVRKVGGPVKMWLQRADYTDVALFAAPVQQAGDIISFVTGCEAHVRFTSYGPFCPVCMDEEMERLRGPWSDEAVYRAVAEVTKPPRSHAYQTICDRIPASEVYDFATELVQHLLAAPVQQDLQQFQPDWANYRQGRADGRAEALEEIAQQGGREPIGWKEKLLSVKLYSWKDEETYGEKFCETFNSGIHAAIEKLEEVFAPPQAEAKWCKVCERECTQNTCSTCGTMTCKRPQAESQSNPVVKDSLTTEAQSKEKTMDDAYGDGSDHISCGTCGLCKNCGDCAKLGCGENDEVQTKEGGKA